MVLSGVYFGTGEILPSLPPYHCSSVLRIATFP